MAGKRNSVVNLDDFAQVFVSKDRGKANLFLEGLKEVDPSASLHKGRGVFWGAMDFLQASSLVKEGADIHLIYLCGSCKRCRTSTTSMIPSPVAIFLHFAVSRRRNLSLGLLGL